MGRLGALWGLAGVTVILGFAIVRLARIAWDALSLDLATIHWIALVFSVVFMAYSEGYRGFQRSYSPRVAARANHLRSNPSLLLVVLAPLFCMGFFYTTRRRLISAYLLVLVIIGFVIIAHQLSQPWRGILDAGVVVGLSWGVASILYFGFRAFTDDEFSHSPELPATSALAGE